MRFFKISLFLFLSQLTLHAQPFESAPRFTKKIKKIVEWTRPDFNRKAQKSSTSIYNKDGRILSFYSEGTSSNMQRVYQYDPQKRLVKSIEGTDVDQEVIRYIYGKRYTTKEKHFREKIYKEVTFRNEKNIAVEQKVYAKGLELGDTYILKDRIVFNYNKKDSLVGEMHYSYLLVGKRKGKKYRKRKVIHSYHKKKKHRIKTTEYDYDKTIREIRSYAYDSKGRIQKIKFTYPKHTQKREIEYKYKNNKIWQEIEQVDNKDTVKIYTDGRLIRLRTYLDEKIFNIVDYQYVYY